MATPGTILAIDTCEGSCSAALVVGERVLAKRSEAIGRGHAERLLPMIDEMLEEAGGDYDGVRRIAVTIGPGTFTGLRIGLSVARGLGLALSKPVVGLTSLQVLAAQAGASEGARVHAALMGRGGQAFYQAFTAKDGALPESTGEPRSMDAADIQARIDAEPGVVIGSGAALLGDDAAVAAIDPVVLARLAAGLDPAAYPPEPAYFRAADAVKAKALLPIEQ